MMGGEAMGSVSSSLFVTRGALCFFSLRFLFFKADFDRTWASTDAGMHPRSLA